MRRSNFRSRLQTSSGSCTIFRNGTRCASGNNCSTEQRLARMQPQPPRKKTTTRWQSKLTRKKSIRQILRRTLPLAEMRPSLVRRPRPLEKTSEKRGATTNRKRRSKLPRRLRTISATFRVWISAPPTKKKISNFMARGQESVSFAKTGVGKERVIGVGFGLGEDPETI